MQLIYYTIGKDVKYLDLLSLSIESLRKYGNYTGDILVIADSATQEAVKTLKDVTSIMPVAKVVKGYQASINKLKIYNYPAIHNYTKILYLDMDILIQQDIQPMFDKIEKISVGVEAPLMCNSPWYGSYLLNKNQTARCRKNKIRGINAGTIGFDIAYLNHIQNIENSLVNDPRIHQYAEQASVNRYLLSHSNIYDTRFNPNIFIPANIDGYLLNKDKTVLHFCGGIGNYDKKINQMREYYKRIIDESN